MKKTTVVCFLLVLTLSLSGCVTLSFSQAQTPLQGPDAMQTLPEQTPTEPVRSVYANAAAWSKEETIAEFCNAVNLVKSTSINYTLQKAVKHEVTFLGTTDDRLPRMAEIVVNKLNHSENVTYTVTGGLAATEGGNVSAMQLISPKGTQFLLTQEQVTDAKASFDGVNLIIVLSLCDDKANAQRPVPALHGECIPYLSFRGQDISPYRVQTAQLDYTNISMAAGIDAAGRLVSMSVSADVTGVGVGAYVLSTAEAKFTATVTETMAFTY